MKSAVALPPPVVFVVDDDPSVREAIDSLIRSVGLRVETFSCAKEFLRRERFYSEGPFPEGSDLLDRQSCR